MWRKFTCVTALIVAGTALYLGAGSPHQSTDHVRSGRFLAPKDNVVVIVIDTLRADHLPFYGYPKNTAPFLNALSQEAVVFENAFSSCSSTAPATASFFTSVLPKEHGVTLGKAVTRNLQKKHPSLELNRVPDHLLTMAEMFQQNGYRTFGLADNLNLCPEMGFDQGFDHFDWSNYEGAEEMNRKLLAIEGRLRSSDTPYFLYLHYMDPHQPYHERSPWYQQRHSRQERKIAAYDSEISYVDSAIAEMAERFRWRENALVVLLSDHGEELWDHGDQGHGITLYREVLHVPFMVYHRNLRTRRISSPVSTLDLPPLLATAAGFPLRPEWRGMNPLATANHPAIYRNRILYQQLLRHKVHERPPLQSAIRNGLHFIATYEKNGRTHYQAFDLHHDFGEQEDLYSKDNPDQQLLLDELRSLEQLVPRTQRRYAEAPL